jgi:putative heme-binding domain-containing protein
LVEELDHPVLTQRLIAADELVYRFGEKAIPDLEAIVNSTGSGRQISSAIAALSRFGAKAKPFVAKSVGDRNRLVRLYAMKAYGSIGIRSEDDSKNVAGGLMDVDAFVAQAAADALGANPRRENIKELSRAFLISPSDDTHRRQAIKIALRDNLVALKDVDALQVAGAFAVAVQQIALAVPNGQGANICIDILQNDRPEGDKQFAYVTHAARYAEGDGVTKLTTLVRERWTDDLDLQLKALLALQQGLAQRGQSSEPLMSWAEELGGKVLDQSDTGIVAWENFPVPGVKDTENPWTFQQRPSADGNKDAIFYSTLVKGEQKTGILRSQPFELPEKFSFWCAGHIGIPDKPILDLNYIRLRAAGSDELLAEARPPRNDTAQRIEWDLTKHKGKKGYVEIIDADTGGAYAWLAVGRFSVTGLNPNETAQRQQLVANLAAQLKLKALQPRLAMLFTSGSLDAPTRGALGTALVAMQPDARAAALVRIVSEPGLEIAARQDLAKAIVSLEDEQLDKALKDALKEVPARTQTAVAETLAGDVDGVTELLQLIEQGRLSANVLRSPVVKQKIAALKHDVLQKEADELTAKLPAVNDVLDKLIVERRKAYDAAKPDLEKGAAVFTKSCANCHQIGGKGAVVGPQLDGIGLRGLDRIIEDILDPNRNVDVAFRPTTFVLTDGKILLGLPKGEEGKQLIVIDNLGKELRINKDDIDEKTPTTSSLMPANVQEIVSPEDFQHLVGYLLGQKTKKGE